MVILSFVNKFKNLYGRMLKVCTVSAVAFCVYSFEAKCIINRCVYAAKDDNSNAVSDKILDLSIEDLMDIEVISVSKKEQILSNTASAIFVITNDDIRRSGFTSVPEVLRMVPGLHVAKMDSNKWAITSRGFNSIFANKLLVMIDGRTVYTPLFAGVYWDVQDVVLEDVERIEVIRGPGATIWGANAVNGVVNIITKNAKDSQGVFFIAGAGDEEKAFGAIRYGSKFSDNIYYRVYAKYFNRDDSEFDSGNRANDEWDQIRGGFRIDWIMTHENSLTVQGDIYNGNDKQTVRLGDNPSIPKKDSADVAGGNIIAHWKHTFSDTSDISLQLYYDRTERDEATIDQVHNTIDMDLFHRFTLGQKNEIIWGLGYRFIGDDIDENDLTVVIKPDTRSNHIFSTFVQDEISFIPDKLKFTIGVKVEVNEYTGFEIQPTARLLWTVNDKNTFWAAVSRAIRSPSRSDNDIRVSSKFMLGDRASISFGSLGNRDLESENLIANEIGYRVLPHEKISFDITAFYNIYDDLLISEPNISGFTRGQPSQLILSAELDNKIDGETYGVEVSTNYQATDYWRLFAGYTYLQIELHPEVTEFGSLFVENNNPHHQFQLRSYMDLPKGFEFDTALYYVESISNGDASSYFRLDSRVGWQINEIIDMSLVFQNLLDTDHQEFGNLVTGGLDSNETERSIFGQISLRY